MDNTVLTQKKKGLLRPEGSLALRVSYRKEQRLSARRVAAPRCLIKCGCCEARVEISDLGLEIEIGGVTGSVENWREVLLPFLGIKQTESGFVDLRVARTAKEQKAKAEAVLQYLRKKYAHP